MGFFSRLFASPSTRAVQNPAQPATPSTGGPPPPWREADERAAAHGFVSVVGESHYQETLRQLSDLFEMIGREDRNFEVTLVPEPTNEFDPNAVRITTEKGSTIGYLPRDIARSYQPILLKQPGVVRCPGRLYGGLDGTTIGVVLDFIQVQKLKAIR